MTRFVGRQMGSYRLTRLLGQGGYAEVYLGEHVYVPRAQAAIKVMGDQFTEAELHRFCDEVSTIFRLVHPSIVRVLDFGVEGGAPFLVMDYAPNGTLRQQHPAGRRVPLETIVPYVKQVAEALQYAHEARVIHRDIKPENLLIGAQQQILLSDFGLAVRAHRPVSQTPQEIRGTATYMAPEQCEGHACQESDQYSLAVMVYEWLSGEPPFSGDSPLSVALQHIRTPPAPLRQRVPLLPPAVEEVVMQALAKDPQARFPSVQAFAAALDAAHQVALPDPSIADLPPIISLLSELPMVEPSSPTHRTTSFQAAVHQENYKRQRQAASVLGKGSLPYFIGGWLMTVIGVFALFQNYLSQSSGGQSSEVTWIVALFAIVIGFLISVGAFLLH